jgi:tRNA modification GTPase
MKKDTIFALASGAGRAGLAVIRVSGPEAGAALTALTGREAPVPRRATRVAVGDPISGDALDEGLAIWFPAPASFTGEDVAELHLHGGRAVAASVLDALGSCPGLRPAEAGEFTRRAFENGKMDLTAAEGLADLVAAETAAQRRQALRQLQGELGARYEGWRGRLLGALAHLEAVIDFSDEDLPGGLETAVHGEISALAEEITGHLRDDRRGERLRDGVYVAIIGPPNAGKSSLLNRLARRDAAIVANTAGTTRDVIEVHLDLGGYPLVMADTAGLRAGGDAIESEGVRRARERAARADLKLAVFDREAWPELDPHTAELVDGDTVVVINKIDLGPVEAAPVVGDRPAFGVSALDGTGIDEMVAELEKEVAARCLPSGSPALTRVRHRAALEDCREGLRRAGGAEEAELAAEDLRLAARALGRITGRVDVEDILDVIFRDFCIGK